MLAGAAFMNVALASFGQDYDYQLTAPIDGWFQQGAADPGLNWEGIGQIFYFGTVSETAYYDPSANTLQQVGSFTLSSTSFSGSFEDDKVVSGTLVPATVAVDYTLNGGNNTVNFDSGIQTVGVNPAFTWAIPFTESITVTTGGQNYDALISGVVQGGNTMTSVSQFTPSSIIISQGYQNLYEEIGSQYYSPINASDGWSADIYDGIGDGSLNESYYVAPTLATAIPEPPSTWLWYSSLLLVLISAKFRSNAASRTTADSRSELQLQR